MADGRSISPCTRTLRPPFRTRTRSRTIPGNSCSDYLWSHHEEGAQMSSEKTLEERVSDLEENIHALNQSLTEAAAAIKALLSAQQAKSVDLQSTLDDVLNRICPFPP